MRTGIVKLASLTLFSLAVLPGTTMAAEKSGCLIFCGDSKTAAARAAKPAAKEEPSGPSIDLETAIQQAQTARKARDFGGAAKILSQLVLFAPDDPRVLGEYGKTLAAQGRTDDALAFLERAIQLTPMDWSLYSAQGVAYDQKGSYSAAQAAYSRALSLKPDEPTVLNNAALSHMQSGDLNGARTLLMQASPATKDYPKIADNLAFVDRLIAARPQAMPPATRPSIVPPPPAPASPPPSKPLAEAPMPAAPPAQAAAAPAPEPMPVIAMTKVETATLSAPNAETAQSAPPKAEAAATDTPAPNSPQLAALKADPTVRMAPIPKEETPAPAPKKLTVSAPEKRVVVASNSAPKANAERPGATYYVQAGAYASEERAGKLAHDLDALGARVSPAKVDGRDVYRVRIGPFLDKEQASEAASQAQSMGHPDLKIISDQ
jgi:Flp pilus assembly protein TadD/cell division septation protein DedD